MRLSNRARNYANNLVNCYAEYNKENESYEVDYDKISSLHKTTLAYHIYIDNPDMLDNACCIENDEFAPRMAPSLLVMLNHQNEDATKDFVDKWVTGLVLYVEKHMIKILEEELEEYNYDMKHPIGEPE